MTEPEKLLYELWREAREASVIVRVLPTLDAAVGNAGRYLVLHGIIGAEDEQLDQPEEQCREH